MFILNIIPNFPLNFPRFFEDSSCFVSQEMETTENSPIFSTIFQCHLEIPGKYVENNYKVFLESRQSNLSTPPGPDRLGNKSRKGPKRLRLANKIDLKNLNTKTTCHASSSSETGRRSYRGKWVCDIWVYQFPKQNLQNMRRNIPDKC